MWSARGVVLTPAFKSLVERKIVKVARLLPKIADARVVCESEKFRRTTRLVLRANRRTFQGEATADDLLAAFEEALESVRRQVRQEKDRRRHHKGRTPRAVAGETKAPAAAERPPTAPAGAGPVVRRLVAKPMAVDEAVMQLRLAEDQFLVFENAESREINVLYRRHDGSLGLIEPRA